MVIPRVLLRASIISMSSDPGMWAAAQDAVREGWGQPPASPV